MTSVGKGLCVCVVRERFFLTVMLFLNFCVTLLVVRLSCHSFVISRIYLKRILNEFNEGTNTTKLGRLFQVYW